MTAFPRSPITEVTPWVGQNISGALLSNFWATRPVTSDSGEKDS